MKTPRIVIAMILLILPFMGMTQQQLEHQKRIYTSPEGKVYIQKSLPVYLRIATSPDEDAKSYLLESEESSKYSNPMYFDTEGWNTVRSPSAVDTSTKKVVYPVQDIIFEVYADSRPPQTESKVSQSSLYNKDGNSYYGDEVQVELTARDALSGMEEIYYSMDGASYKPYSEAIHCNEEKKYELKYYSVDNVRNVEQPHSMNFVIDKTSPETSYSIEGDNKENILGKDAFIRLSSEDASSGVREIRYRINGGPEKVYNKPISVRNFDDDNNELVFYAIDNVNNKEERQSLKSSVEATSDGDNGDGFSFYIDREAPSVELRVNGDQYEDKHLFVSKRSRIEIMARDDKSGVKKISYSINNSSLSQSYEKPFELAKPGLQYVNYEAEDQVNNVSARQTKSVYLDTGLPSSDIHFEGENYKSRDTIFVKPDTRISFSGSDQESGMKEVMYKVDKASYSSYSQPVSIEKEGLHVLSFYGADQVSNKEEERQVNVYVDRSAPEIYHHFSVQSIGSKTIRDEKYVIYPSNCRLYIAATDMACGTKLLRYRLNSGEWNTTIPLPKLEPGNHEVEIQATDYLGNQASTVVNFAIEH
jgi:hypothetical protein